MLVKVIHDVRLAARELGRRMAKLTPEGRPDDLWYVTYAELDNYRRDPGAFADLVASRRATRDALSQLVPPFCFSGEMPPIETWERRAEHTTEAATAGTVLTGIPGCSGVVRGRACVVTDPSDPGDLGPGDILIAPLTDPSWTPLFVPVHDVGVEVNPLLVRGQVHGGIAQGAGQALMENIHYDGQSGQLLSGSLMDYALPRADDFTDFDVASHPVPTETNPLGVKGAGECGTIGALAAVMNALNDALAPLGVRNLAMPATPERVWRAIRDASPTDRQQISVP